MEDKNIQRKLEMMRKLMQDIKLFKVEIKAVDFYKSCDKEIIITLNISQILELIINKNNQEEKLHKIVNEHMVLMRDFVEAYFNEVEVKRAEKNLDFSFLEKNYKGKKILYSIESSFSKKEQIESNIVVNEKNEIKKALEMAMGVEDCKIFRKLLLERLSYLTIDIFNQIIFPNFENFVKKFANYLKTEDIIIPADSSYESINELVDRFSNEILKKETKDFDYKNDKKSSELIKDLIRANKSDVVQ